MKTSPDKEKLFSLIKKAREGKIVLPQFQRNFVWSRSDITDLLNSIFEGYFIGSFLMLDTEATDPPFAMRAIQGVDIMEYHLRPEWMILDGQQRLTSLHYVFAAPDIPMRYTSYPYRFFLDLRKIAEGDVEGAIWSERSDYVNGWLEADKQYETLNIPFTEIERWDDWIREYENRLRKDQALYDFYWDNYRTPWYDMLTALRNFDVPIIEIEKVNGDNPDQVGQVCAIFEKMNSTGVRLSVYDLLTARMYRHKIDLHQLWEKTVSQHDTLNAYSGGEPDDYGVYLLRTIALLRNKDVKSKTLINLSPLNFEADWEKAAHFMEQALRRTISTNADGFGVFDKKWAAYSTMISPLAGLLAYIDDHRLDHRAYKLLRRWYWASAFRERYAGSVESTIYRDYQDLTQAFEDPAFEPLALADARTAIVENTKYTLMDTSRVNAIYRAVMCLVALRGAKDFRADDSIEFHTLDDHHIFPKAYLGKSRQPDGSQYSNDLVNCILNRTLITSTTNRSISRKSPADYVAQLVPDERVDDIMDSHFINADALRAMRENDFESFLLYRETALVEEIRRQLMG